MHRTVKNSLRKALTLAATLAATTGAAWAQPQMVATLDGADLPSFSQVNFDEVNLGETRQLVIVLRNQGSQDLEFLETPAVQLSGAFAEQFVVIQPALEVGSKLSPNASTAFAVRFEPTVEFANLNANVFIFTNEQAAPFRLSVRGSGTAPELEVLQDNDLLAAEDQVDFGEVTVGETATLTLDIKNAGSGPLALSQQPEIAGGLGELVMSIEGSVDTQIEAGESSPLTVKFTPSDARPYATNLFIHTQSADGNQIFRLNLTGTGVEAEIEDPGDDENDEQDDNQNQDDDQNEDDDQDQEDDDNNDDDNNNEDPDDVEDDVIADPNLPTGNDDIDENDEQVDPNDAYVADPNDGYQGDLDDDQQDDDQQVETDHEADQVDIEIDPDLVTPLTCGFGAGFASLASMASLGGLSRRKRRIN